MVFQQVMSSAVSPNILPIKPALSIVLVQFIGRTIITEKKLKHGRKLFISNQGILLLMLLFTSFLSMIDNKLKSYDFHYRKS